SAYESTTAATRQHFAKALNELEIDKPILSGCADLTPSVLSKIEGATDLCAEKGINAYLRFGIREHCMCAVMNGIAAHGVFVPVGGTFLNFITYGFPSVRLAALDRLKVVYVLTHDSIQLGGDGPTHQPIEVLATMRATPGLVVLRPCDGRETRAALAQAMKEEGPVAVVLSRQPCKEIDETAVNFRNGSCTDGVECGAYFLIREEHPDVVLLATGAEVGLAYEVRSRLKDRRVSIVSFVSFELFERQNAAYKAAILPSAALKVSIEALSTFGWARYSDLQIGLDEFGRSGDGAAVYEFFGFTPEKIASRITERLA
ncbi:transketolase, partial [Pancytospora philotis]